MQRVFILALAICVTLAAALGTFLFVSLVPYFSLIGKVAAGVVITMLACTAILAAVFTYSLASNMLAKRHLIVAGDVVAYIAPNRTFIHLSAQHEAAKVVPHMLPAPVEEEDEPGVNEQEIVNIYNTGLSIKETAKVFHATEYRVREIVTKAGVVRKR